MTPLRALVAVAATVVVTAGVAGAADGTHGPAIAAAGARRIAPPLGAPVAVPQQPARIVVVGDSTAMSLFEGMAGWTAAHPEYARVVLAGSPGCGFIRGDFFEEEVPFQQYCDVALDRDLPRTLTTFRPTVAVLMVTFRDLEDRQWDQREGVLTPFDPRYRSRMLDAYRTITAQLEAAGVSRIVWIHAPIPRIFLLSDRAHMADPARHAVQRGVIEQVRAEHAGSIRTFDLEQWLADQNLLASPAMRPDGLHLSPAGAADVTERALLPIALA